MPKPTKYLIISQLIFVIGSFINFWTIPEAFAKNTAISYYGTNPRTLPVYIIGALGSATFILLAVRAIQASSYIRKIARVSLTLVAACVLLALVTPYSVNSYFFVAHMSTALLLMLIMLVTSVIVTVRLKNLWLATLSAALFTSAITTVLSFGFWDIIHVLAWSELAAAIIYTSVIVYSLKLDTVRSR